MARAAVGKRVGVDAGLNEGVGMSEGINERVGVGVDEGGECG